MMKNKKKKSKRDILLEGLGIAFVVFIVGLFIMNAMFQPKFQKAYDRGYEQGQEDCSLLVFNTSDQPDSINYNVIILNNFSLNFS